MSLTKSQGAILRSMKLIDMKLHHVDLLVQMEADAGIKHPVTKKELRKAIEADASLYPRCIQVQTTGVPWICGHLLVESHTEYVVLQYLFLHRAIRKYGIGTAVINKLKEQYLPRRPIMCPVPDEQLAEHLFLRANGFKAVEVIRNWNEEGDDMYVFQYPPEIRVQGGR